VILYNGDEMGQLRHLPTASMLLLLPYYSASQMAFVIKEV
jgi:hypothetical protein